MDQQPDIDPGVLAWWSDVVRGLLDNPDQLAVAAGGGVIAALLIVVLGVVGRAAWVRLGPLNRTAGRLRRASLWSKVLI